MNILGTKLNDMLTSGATNKLSSMRAVFMFSSTMFMITWSFISIYNRAFIHLTWEDSLFMSTIMGSKAVSNWIENKCKTDSSVTPTTDDTPK